MEDFKAIVDLVSGSTGIEHAFNEANAEPRTLEENEHGEFFGTDGSIAATKKSKRVDQCCKNLKISSSGIVSEMYPFLLGVYENQEASDSSPVYKMENQNRFLSRPYGFSKSGTHTYSWGVNSSPMGKWGWIKAFSSGACPHQVKKWRVFHPNIKKWVSDNTLNITCTRKL